MNRHDVTELIVTQRLAKGLSWADIAKAVGHSKEWVTAGCLGQMTFTAEQAAVIGEMLELPAPAVKLLQVVATVVLMVFSPGNLSRSCRAGTCRS